MSYLWAGEVTLWPGTVVNAVVVTLVVVVLHVVQVVLIKQYGSPGPPPVPLVFVGVFCCHTAASG